MQYLTAALQVMESATGAGDSGVHGCFFPSFLLQNRSAERVTVSFPG